VAQTTPRPKRPLWHYIVAGFIIAIPIAWFTMPEPAPPAVPQEAIDDAVAFITQDPMVRDAAIRIENDQIVLAIVANRAINQQYARQLGDNFARYFATATATWASDERLKKTPTRDFYGGVWEHYTGTIVIAFDADTVFQRGTLAKGGSSIRW